MGILKPNLYLSSVFEITPQLLNKLGITTLLLDVDNTLCIYHTDYPIDGVREWISTMQNAGIELHILSNAKPRRLTRFAEKVGLPCFYLSMKPLPFKISKAVKRLCKSKTETALVGDQIFTDILGGNLSGVTTIWLDYIEIEQSRSFRFKRKLEEKIKRKLKKGDVS